MARTGEGEIGEQTVVPHEGLEEISLLDIFNEADILTSVELTLSRVKRPP